MGELTTPVTIGALWRQWRDVLAENGSPSAVIDAKRLTAHALGLGDLDLAVRERDVVDAGAAARVEALMQRRLTGESVARIIGEREFYGLAFALNPATLEPRPETELLVDMALTALPPGGRLLDLGTGTGCIPIAVLANRPDATAVAVDLSEEALDAARANAERHGVAERIAFLQGSWFEPLAHPPPNLPRKGGGAASSVSGDPAQGTEAHLPPCGGGREGGGRGAFHLIVSNPPYIASAVVPTLSPEVRAFDPALALDGGPDGLAPYRIIAAEAPLHLAFGGGLLVEIGYDQGDAVAAILARQGWRDIAVHKDLAGLDRVVSAHHL
ncbi:N5-glutamine methyltransferase family protein [Devosia albogilva]|uniref:Release factor glutamine methyltransferase n=1 Tax=Devosia albogilva TaxID=429726 RepID=A0ABW5QIP9_9HYPH